MGEKTMKEYLEGTDYEKWFLFSYGGTRTAEFFNKIKLIRIVRGSTWTHPLTDKVVAQVLIVDGSDFWLNVAYWFVDLFENNETCRRRLKVFEQLFGKIL